MRTVNEVSKLSGVSVRTLHHYDAIGLLKPTTVTEAGYRLYDDTALRRLQTILLFRELQFPLKEIKAILDSPTFDPAEALEQQIHLLELQQKRLGEVIAFARSIQTKGVDSMNFDIFDRTEIDQYADEVKSRWGSTEAYRQFSRKTGRDHAKSGEAMMELFAELGKLRHLSPAAEEVQENVAAIQAFITDNFYTCTDAIFRGLGQMYAADPRFKANIDRAGGEGTAEFACRAIEIHCSR